MTHCCEFINAYEQEPSLRIERVAGSAGILLLRSSVRYPYSDVWTAESSVSTWTPDDVTRAAAWFARHATSDAPVSTEGVWFGSPEVGFRVIDRDDTTIALDFCWTAAQDVARPTLTGGEAAAVGGDTRYAYWTIDMLHETFSTVAAVWANWDADFR